MNDNELKFFDPETGAELHRVPEGATIPKDVQHGYALPRGSFIWRAMGRDIEIVRGMHPHFTREPIDPPAPPLPTEPGYYLDKDGRPCALRGGRWYLFGVEYPFRANKMEWGAPFVPVTLVPTETWDRLRVLDPEDTRDRVDRDGDLMRFAARPKARWGEVLATVHWHYGPLRFADEVSDQ